MAVDRAHSEPLEPAGRGEGPTSTRVGELDLADRGDRYKLIRAIRGNWSITPERKRAYFAALDEVIRRADPDDKAGQIAIVQAVKALLTEQGHAMKDLHVLEERDRLDAGKATANIAHTVKAPPDYDALRRRMLGGTRSN